jgi:hypothetical protein
MVPEKSGKCASLSAAGGLFKNGRPTGTTIFPKCIILKATVLAQFFKHLSLTKA